MADCRCKRRKQSHPRRKNVDLENMPDDPETDNHSGMRSSISPPHPSSNSDLTGRNKSHGDLHTEKLLANGKVMNPKEQRPPNGILPSLPLPPVAHSGEEEKIQEYLQRSDTAVIYPEPVGRIKESNAADTDARNKTMNEQTENEDVERSKTVSGNDYLLKCPHCDRVFAGNEAICELKGHLADSHHEAPVMTPKTSETAKNSHPCTKCNATFADKESLTKHKLFHTANGQGSTAGGTDDTSALRKFKCPECGKAFKFKHHLKEHIRIHSGEKPFACQNCGKRFSHSGSYSSHMTSKKCLVVNLKVRKVDARSPRGRSSTQNNSFRPIIPKYGSHSTAAATANELPLVPAGYMPSSERFPAFLSPNRAPQSYVPLTFHPLLTSTPPYMPIGNFPEVTQLLQHRLENEASEEKAQSQSQMSSLSTDKFDDHLETPQPSERGLNAVKKILEIVDATVKQQNQQSQQPEKTRNGLLSELLSAAPQTLSKSLTGGESHSYDTRCRFCCRLFENRVELHQHERYLCALNSDLHNPKPGDIRPENNSDGESSKESSEEGLPKISESLSVLNSENLSTLKAHYQMNPRPKKSELIRLSRDLKCPTRAVQAWFHSQHHNSGEHINGDSPGSPPALHPMPSSPFNSVIPHYNGALPTSAASVVPFRAPPALESSQNVHSNYKNHETDDDQPLDLSVKSKRENSPVCPRSPDAVESEVLNLSQKSSRVATPPKDSSYHSHRLQINQIHDYQSRETSPQPNLRSSLLYKYMQMGLSTTIRSPQHESSPFNPPLAAVTPSSPERSPSQAEGPRTMPSPDAASCADNCSSPSGTVGSYGHMEENNEADAFSPSSGKKLRIWHQGEGDESTLDDSPGPEEDSSGGSGKMRKSWKIHKVESEEGMYACDQCDKMFSKQSSLARHKYEHSGQRPHKCDVCNKAFKHKHHLTEHKRLHSGEKPFQCKKCLKRFSHSGSYSQHMNHRYSYCKPYHE